MRKLSFQEQAFTMGGYNEDGCRAVQAQANALTDLQNKGFKVPDEVWDKWAESFDENCV